MDTPAENNDAAARCDWPALKAPLRELEGNYPADLSSTTFEERFLMVWEPSLRPKS